MPDLQCCCCRCCMFSFCCPPPGVGHYVCLSWLPTYYNQEFGVDVQQSALLSVLPW